MEDILNLIDKKNFELGLGARGGKIGELYQQSIDTDTKKALGKYYTPSYIVDFILNNTLEQADVLKKPFLKILDPACGCGFFLIKAYDILKEKFQAALPMLREKYADEPYIIKKDGEFKRINGKEYWQKDNLHYIWCRHRRECFMALLCESTI